jgi:hypothetical protein
VCTIPIIRLIAASPERNKNVDEHANLSACAESRVLQQRAIEFSRMWKRKQSLEQRTVSVDGGHSLAGRE